MLLTFETLDELTMKRIATLLPLVMLSLPLFAFALAPTDSSHAGC